MRGIARALTVVAACSAIAPAMQACVADEVPPPYRLGGTTTGAGGSGDGFDAGITDGPPPLDAPGLCGNQIHQAVSDAPNLYFVLDASGSMAAPEGSSTRYDAVRNPVLDLIRKLGPLINVGAAVFPRFATANDPCHVGGQVFPVTQGDPITGMDGPTTEGFRLATIVANPIGGTPTAATLAALTPKLTALSGRTIVLLATDGAPNCNESASCGESECMGNLEGECEPGTNCCAPGGLYGPSSCVDRPAVIAAIEALAGAGIDVYVIGVPGSAFYGSVLDEMAIAGGVAQAQAPFYYRIDDVSALEGVLSDIASVLVSCEFQVESPPAEQGHTNVYLDDVVLPYSGLDGWIWKTDSIIELRGEACARLKKGEIAKVQIVSGCPTEVPK